MITFAYAEKMSYVDISSCSSHVWFHVLRGSTVSPRRLKLRRKLPSRILHHFCYSRFTIKTCFSYVHLPLEFFAQSRRFGWVAVLRAQHSHTPIFDRGVCFWSVMENLLSWIPVKEPLATRCVRHGCFSSIFRFYLRFLSGRKSHSHIACF